MAAGNASQTIPVQIMHVLCCVVLYYTNHAHTIMHVLCCVVLHKSCTYNFDFCKNLTTLRILINNKCEKLTPVFWVLSLGLSSFQGANLLLLQCYSMLSTAAVYGNGMYYILGQAQVILGPVESTMSWTYCCLPMNHVEERLSLLGFWI